MNAELSGQSKRVVVVVVKLYEHTVLMRYKHTWYDRMMACTDRWSSMTLPSVTPDVTELTGATVAWTLDLMLGGARYAAPGGAPCDALRKNASHDCKQTHFRLDQ